MENDQSKSVASPLVEDQRLIGLGGLSEREIFFAELMAQGLSNRAIENQLGVAGGLVARYVAIICQKLKVRSRDQAVLAWQTLKAKAVEKSN